MRRRGDVRRLLCGGRAVRADGAGEPACRAGAAGTHGARDLRTQPDGQSGPDDARHAPHARGGDDAAASGHGPGTGDDDAAGHDDAPAGHGDGAHVRPHEVVLLAHRARVRRYQYTILCSVVC